MGEEPAAEGKPPDFWQKATRVLGEAAPSAPRKRVRNVGPSYQYKIRDAQGQAREYHNYMLPLAIDGAGYLVCGVRDAPNEPFRYLRFPVDENDGIEGYHAFARHAVRSGALPGNRAPLCRLRRCREGRATRRCGRS